MALNAQHDLDRTVAELVLLGADNEIELDQLADAVRTSETEIRRALLRLNALGYPLSLLGGSVRRGSFEPIDAHQLNHLQSRKIGRKVEWRLHVRSTQDELKRIEQQAEDGTVLLTETQGSGRGRLMRDWVSPFGGIWLSVLLRPTWPKSHQLLTLAFATAVARAMSVVAGISSAIKWPNDLIVQSRKIAGILAEASYQGDKLNSIIVGLGINANIGSTRFPEELRGSVTSVSQELGREIDRTLLTRKILEEMDNVYCRFECGEVIELLREVIGLCSTIGQMVAVTTVEEKFTGEAVNIGEDGQLIVRLSNGSTVPLYAADIVHLR